MKRFAFACLLVATIGVGCGSEETAEHDEESENAQSVTSSQDSPLEGLPRHPRFELSNLRFPTPDSFEVNWRLSSGESAGTWMLVVKSPGSNVPMSMVVNVWNGERSGKLEGEMQSFGFRSSGPSLESGCEMYMTADEAGHTFKVSNSITSGNSSTTAARPVSQEIVDAIARTEEQHQKAAQPTADQSAPSPPIAQNDSPPIDRGTFPREFPRSRSPFAENRRLDDPNLVSVPDGLTIPNGTPLMAEWAQRWNPVTVLESGADGQLKIRWDDYGENWDEFKPRGELRIERSVLAKLRIGNAQAPTPSPPPAANGGPPYQPGQKLEAKWANRWLPVTVLSVQPGGMYRVHWEDYTDAFDSNVRESELRPPAP